MGGKRPVRAPGLISVDWVLGLRHPVLTDVFLVLTHLGDASFFLVFLSVGYWFVHRPTFFRLTLLVIVSALLNSFLKGLFQVPRPEEIPHLVAVGGWSFPSNHAQLAAALWPALALEARRKWAGVAAAVLVVGISASRVYLGVHRPVDVVVGMALGLMTVAAARLVWSRPWPRWERLGPVAAGAVISAGALVFLALLPGGVEPVSVVAAGAGVGLWIGELLRRRRTRDEPPRGALKVIAALVLGLGGAFALRTGVALAADRLAVMPEVADFLRYGILGLWITLLAPAAFLALGLAEPSASESGS